MPTLGNAETSEILLPLPLAADAAPHPQPRGLQPARPVEARRDRRAGAAGDERASPRAFGSDHPDVYPPNGGLTFSIVPLQEQVVGGVRRSLIVLIAGGRVRPADRLRERGEPAAGACAVAASGKSRSDRRSARGRPDRAAVADRERRARAGGRGGGAVARHGGAWPGFARSARRACRGCTRSPSTGGCSCSRWRVSVVSGWCSGWRRRCAWAGST